MTSVVRFPLTPDLQRSYEAPEALEPEGLLRSPSNDRASNTTAGCYDRKHNLAVLLNELCCIQAMKEFLVDFISFDSAHSAITPMSVMGSYIVCANLATIATLTPAPICLPSSPHIPLSPSSLSLPGTSFALHQQFDEPSGLALTCSEGKQFTFKYEEGKDFALRQEYKERLQELVAAAPPTLVPELGSVSVLQKARLDHSWDASRLGPDNDDEGGACWRCPLDGCRLTAMCRCLRIIQACCKGLKWREEIGGGGRRGGGSEGSSSSSSSSGPDSDTEPLSDCLHQHCFTHPHHHKHDHHHHANKKGYCITMDNYYTSPNLAELLVAQRTDCYGTVRANRKNMPPQLRNTFLKRGEIKGYRKGKILVLKWKEKKDVTLLSTIHSTEQSQIQTRRRTTMKSMVVCDYNHSKGGVDKADQHLSDYPVAKKRTKKYYRNLFFHMFGMAVWNSYLLYNKAGKPKLSPLEYRTQVVRQSIEKYRSECPAERPGRPSSFHHPARYSGGHFPV
ncbi:PiggyBac transposable element-derived protein [Trinorchestia longiramus]|nr:PiggyBac transposable element-derived protein [Trinorchestia longiramus]